MRDSRLDPVLLLIAMIAAGIIGLTIACFKW